MENGNHPSESVRKHLGIASNCGFLAIIASPVSYTIVAILQPNYSMWNQSISSLGEVGAPFALYISIMFVIGGFLEVTLASGLYLALKPNKWALLGSILIAGTGFFSSSCSGIFPMGAAWTGTIHSLTSTIGVYCMMIAPFVVLIAMRKQRSWKDLRITTWIVLVLFMVGLGLENVVNFYHTGSGAVQRLEDFTYYFWILCFAVKFKKVAQKPPSNIDITI
ncbi:MAG TPA: DUF998 domain-containing protein [Candidatus Lokiarchaeia archaeon]|nr:DUF998 domain-containing protein [Candidatus Lokiarchaeia archaeon]